MPGSVVPLAMFFQQVVIHFCPIPSNKVQMKVLSPDPSKRAAAHSCLVTAAGGWRLNKWAAILSIGSQFLRSNFQLSSFNWLIIPRIKLSTFNWLTIPRTSTDGLFQLLDNWINKHKVKFLTFKSYIFSGIRAIWTIIVSYLFIFKS